MKLTDLRYALHPGWIPSKNDGDWHYINCQDLMRLYGVPANLCISWHSRPRYRGEEESFVHLFPDYDGKYDLLELLKRYYIGHNFDITKTS